MRLGFTDAGRADFKRCGAAAIEDIRARIPAQAGASLAPDNYEGVRINFDREHGDGWALIRQSLHEPILPVNFESNAEGGCLQIARALCALLAPYGGEIDLTKLRQYAQR